MKYLFATILAVLVAASLFTRSLNPAVRSSVPILYWVTDSNPAREVQVSTFQRWLQKHDYPRFDLRLDMVNVASDKIVIQGVSGVCADIIGHCGGANMTYRQAVGILEDVTERALELGFDPSQTYEAMGPEITIDGRQYAFPCNVYVHLLWVSRDTFTQYGLPCPSRRWTFEEFEDLGKRFCAAANRPDEPRRHFLVPYLSTQQMHRSLGLSQYNETLTACILDDPRMVRVLELYYKWTYEDHILPTLAERDSFATESGYGGSTIQLFNSGNYALFPCGRYGLIQLRTFQKNRREKGMPRLDLDVVEFPHGGFPNAATGTRAAAVYKGGNHRDLAVYFLAYLASEDYNMNIVRDADALPPNPKYTLTQAYLRPLAMLPDLTAYFPYGKEELRRNVAEFAPEFYTVTDTVDRDQPIAAADLPAPPCPLRMDQPAYRRALAEFRREYDELMADCRTEWGCHEMFSERAQDIAIPYSTSPFILNTEASRIINKATEEFLSDRCSAPEAVRAMQEGVNAEIAQNLREDPKKQPLYDRLCVAQARLDALRAQGRKVPLDLIQNPFHRRYYQVMGWAE
ncbi:MAG: carbohydrate ABC transporter substrate-binding protein [Lentisphaeria bacterium]|nr:carbohydrate ABC transporter substrate-binding protein [Lentisphaeria bacterium]